MSEPTTQSIVAKFLRQYMALDVKQVVVFNQRWPVPAKAGLLVVVSSQGFRPFGASSEIGVSADGREMLEHVSVPSQELIAVDSMSADQSAVDRRHEFPAALASVPMQQLCEQYAMKVARVPASMVDISKVEGAARLNRFNMVLAVLRTRTTTRVIETFDKFRQPALVIEP